MHAALPHHLYVLVDNCVMGLPPGVTPGVLHALWGRPGQVLLGHVLLETGAHWSDVPLHHLYHLPRPAHDDDALAPEEVQPWGCMGTDIRVSHMPYLEGLRISVLGSGTLGRCTGLVVDWLDGYSRYPEQHKPLHLVALDNGHYAALPNNRLRWADPSFVDARSWAETRMYRRNRGVFWTENGDVQLADEPTPEENP